MKPHLYLGRRVQFWLNLNKREVKVIGTVIRTSGYDITVNNIMPEAPGRDEVTFDPKDEVTFDETKKKHRMVSFLQTTYSLGGE